LADKKKNIHTKKTNPAKPVAPNKQSNTLLAWICVTVITIVTFIVFSPSLNDGFTNWDDPVYVMGNPMVVNNSIPLLQIFETQVAANYHPLTVLSFALNYQTGKLDPMQYHMGNVILHLLNTILVFFFIFLLTRRNLLMAAIVSLFFGIHPMHVESVAWISERKDVLYVFFFLAGLITYLRYIETKKLSWYIFTLLLFILSCLSKGMAVVLPVVLLLIDYLKGVKWERRLLIEKIPFFILSLIFGIIAFKIQQSGKAITDMKTFSIFQHLMFASYSAIMYIVKLFVPVNLLALYPYPNITGSIPFIFYLSPFIMLAILLVLVYLFMKKQKEIVFGLLFYFVTVVLVLQFVSVGRVIMADRYSYLSYIGLLFIAAYLINKAWQSKSGVWAILKYPLVIIAVIVAITFSYRAYSRTQVWKNSYTLWSQDIETYPNASLAYYERAFYYHDINDTADDLSDLNKAISSDPDFADAYSNRGVMYLNAGKIDKAIADNTKAIILNPASAPYYLNRAVIYSGYYNRNDLAIADYSKAIALNDTFKKAYFNRALLYVVLGKNDSALADFNKVIELDPVYEDAYTNRGLLYYKTGMNDLAMADFNKVIELNPASVNAYNDRAILKLNAGKIDLALADYTKAISYAPSTAPCYFNRALCYEAANQYEKAVDDFSKAIELNPSAAVFWLNRSYAENKIGKIELAKADELKGKQLQGK
jgi:protein O-mannosyl-transferase